MKRIRSRFYKSNNEIPVNSYADYWEPRRGGAVQDLISVDLNYFRITLIDPLSPERGIHKSPGC